MSKLAVAISEGPSPRGPVRVAAVRADGVQFASLSILLGWLIVGVLLISPAGIAPVDRTQEARVLETAREMLGADIHNWMIPHLNGALRLEKPPLAYWMAAGSFRLFGVSEWAGRLPFLVVGWLSLGLTYLIARDMFGRRAGLFAVAALLGSLLFARHTSVAETDILVLACMQLAVYAFGRALDAALHAGQAIWLHAGFAAIGLTGMAKGMPFAFPLLYFIALVIATRRWDLLRNALRYGAPLTALLIAVPWFVYVISTEGAHTLLREARVAAVGEGHRSSFLTYIPALGLALAPWTVVTAAAVAVALSRRHRRDTRIKSLLLWAACVIVPLCFIGQKQKHYLMPALPPLMILTGWYMDRLVRASSMCRNLGAGRVVLLAMVLMCAGGSVALPFIGHAQRGVYTSLDWAAAAALFVLSMFALSLMLRNDVARTAYVIAGAAAVGVPMLVSLWIPTFEPITPRAIATEVQQSLGPRNYCFYKGYALNIGFSLGQVVPIERSGAALVERVRRDPRLILVMRETPGDPPKSMPPGYVRRLSFKTNEGAVHFCEFTGGDPEIVATDPAPTGRHARDDGGAEE